MEGDSGAKIAIRGKGSVKEGKGRSDAAHASNQEEDLHCLIMADTEDKVNKAKKLIHNVIETVSVPPLIAMLFTNEPRLHRFLKARTNSSVTSSENSPPSTVPSETTRTRLARTVARSVTASMTALRSRTTLPVSSVASVVTRATWLAIVPTASVVPAGVTAMVQPDLLVVSIAEMPLTVNTSNSCKSLVEDLLDPLRALRLALALRTTAARSRGNEALPVDLHHGAAVTKILTKEDRQLPGPENAAVATRIAAPVMAVTVTTGKHMAVLQALLLHGSNKLLELRLGMARILDMVPMVLLLEWPLRLVLGLLVVPLHLLLVLLLDWVTLMPSSSSMLVQLLLRRRPLVTPRHHLPVISLLHLHLPVPN
jgi:hypothetical protein